MAVMHAAIVEISFDLLREWLHLPHGVRIDSVANTQDFESFVIRMRSDNDFLPEVPDGAKAPRGWIVYTEHPPTARFEEYV